MPPEEARIAELEAKLARRRGQKGFEQNVKEIEAEIARLKEQG
jgi:ribosome-interacting GTPase 1